MTNLSYDELYKQVERATNELYEENAQEEHAPWFLQEQAI